MTDRIRRIVLGAAIPLVTAGIGLGPYLVYRSDLPDRVASHFGVSGRADGSMTPQQFLIVLGTMMALGLGACVVIAVARRTFQPMVAPMVSFVGAFIGGLSAGILATTAFDQRGLQRWEDATLDPWMLIGVIGGGLLVGSLAARLASALPHTDTSRTGEVPSTMELAPGERAYWSSTLSARWPVLSGLVVFLIALVLVRVVEPWIVGVLLVVAVGAVSFARIRVTVDRSGLQIRYGFLGWPRTSVPIRRIATAQAIDIRPAQWGGWGYRGSLKLARRAAVVLRAGPGIRVDLHDGGVFAVTIDDPDQPVRLLNAEVARLAGADTHSP